MKRYELVNNDAHGGWATRTEMEPDPTGDWVKHEDAQAELTALREAVRVLGKHVAAWKHTNEMYLEGSGSDIELALEGVRLAEEATNANLIALAAVEKA